MTFLTDIGQEFNRGYKTGQKDRNLEVKMQIRHKKQHFWLMFSKEVLELHNGST